jgi:hypothetical protein
LPLPFGAISKEGFEREYFRFAGWWPALCTNGSDLKVTDFARLSTYITRLERDRDFRPWRFVDRGDASIRIFHLYGRQPPNRDAEITLPVDGRLVKASTVYAFHDTEEAGTKVRQADVIEIWANVQIVTAASMPFEKRGRSATASHCDPDPTGGLRGWYDGSIKCWSTDRRRETLRQETRREAHCRELRSRWPRNAPVINIEAEQAAEVASLMYSGPGEQRDTRQITERHSDLVGNSAAGGKRAGKCELVSRTKASSRSNSGRRVSLPEALSMKVLATDTASSCRSGFWSKLLTRT